MTPGPTTEGPAALVAKARGCLAHFGRYGTVRDLDAAIRLLGSATQAERRTGERAALYGELAEALLRRWLVRPLPEDLPEALEAAQNAISGGARAYLTLAQVLEAMAEEVSAGRLSTKLMPEWVWVQAARPVTTPTWWPPCCCRPPTAASRNSPVTRRRGTHRPLSCRRPRPPGSGCCDGWP